MRRSHAFVLPLVLVVSMVAAVAAAGHRDAPAPADEVVTAERAFAARAQEVDPRDAFVEWFASDAIAFGKVPGPAFPGLTEGPPWGIDLKWRPVDAGIARSADFGWTTGPAEYRRTKTDATPYRWGFYTSVWIKQADGRWKVAADIGASVPQPTMAIADWDAEAAAHRATRDGKRGAWHPKRWGPTAEERAEDLMAVDRKLAARAGKHAADAFGDALLREARYHRDGIPPAIGRNAALGALRDGSTTYGWAPFGALVADSGELGYSYGSGEQRTTTGAVPFHYLAVWEKHDGRWQLRVLVHHLVPKPAG